LIADYYKGLKHETSFFAEFKDILNKIDSIKSVLDGYRLFPDDVLNQLRDMTYEE